MSITDELREFMNGADGYELWCPHHKKELLRIADRIDAEHERQMADAFETRNSDENLESDGWVRLPKDADGEPWRIGDELLMENEVCEVVGVGGNCGNTIFYAFDNGVEWTLAHNNRHYHKPTVEDVLRDLLEEYSDPTCDATPTELAEKYAAKLQLTDDYTEHMKGK